MKSIRVMAIVFFILSCTPKKENKESVNEGQKPIDTLQVRHIKLDSTLTIHSFVAESLMQKVKPRPLPILKEAPSIEGFDSQSTDEPNIIVEPKKDSLNVDDIIPMADAPLNEYPFYVSGKIIVDFGNNDIYECSCQFVSKFILMTAAHCINFDGREAERIVFQLKYNKGNFSKSYIVKDMIYWSSYIDVGSYDDYAFLKIDKTEDVPDSWLGIAGGPTSRRTNSMGYPSNIMNGQVLQNVIGFTDGRIPYGEYYYMTENPFGTGSSGGAWFNNDGYIVGINSFGVTGTPNTMFSSYLGKDNLVFRLFEEAKQRFEKK